MKHCKRIISLLFALVLTLNLVVPATFAAEATAETGVPYVTTDELNLRTGPGTGYSIILAMPKGSKVSITSTKNESWYKGTYTNSKGKSFTGYMSSKYLKKATPPTGEYTTTGDVYLRSGPGTSYAAKTVVKSGKTVTVTNTDNAKWYKVTYTTKSTTYKGYISSKYLTKKKTPTYPTYVATGDVYLRSGPGTGYDIKTVVKCGAKVKVLDKSNTSWYKVSYTNAKGTTFKGYVSSKYLKKA